MCILPLFNFSTHKGGEFELILTSQMPWLRGILVRNSGWFLSLPVCSWTFCIFFVLLSYVQIWGLWGWDGDYNSLDGNNFGCTEVSGEGLYVDCRLKVTHPFVTWLAWVGGWIQKASVFKILLFLICTQTCILMPIFKAIRDKVRVGIYWLFQHRRKTRVVLVSSGIFQAHIF